MTTPSLQLTIFNSKIGATIPFPSYASAHAAGLSLRACVERPYILAPAEKAIIPLGFGLVFQERNMMGVIRSSPQLIKQHHVVALSEGVVVNGDEADELFVCLENRGKKPFVIEPGAIIALLTFEPVIRVSLDVNTYRSNIEGNP